MIKLSLELDKVIYFDGVCNLCHWAVRLIVRLDKKNLFSFAALQSEYARKHIAHANGQNIKLESVVYQFQDRTFIKSDAVLEIIREIRGFWSVLLILKVIPKTWRDGLYDVIANRRYNWFGKRDSCIIPTDDIKLRFLD